ncbi:MAG: hypothetical protein LBT14_03275 [Treponema sp.]|jgi:hypothetical protein|nr:hypothetical protein [Treponema sp.]
MKLLNKLKRFIGLKNRYTVDEIKEDGKLQAAVILDQVERETLSRRERMERFNQWQKEQGI